MKPLGWVTRALALGVVFAMGCSDGAPPSSGTTCGCTGRECGSNGCGGSCGTCGVGLICVAGTCLNSGTGTCSAAVPDGTCPFSQICTGGSCCQPEQACGAVCCDAASVCVQDASGNRSCASRCTSTSECPGVPGSRCCMVLNAPGGSTPLPYGACGTFAAGVNQCRCDTGSDCGSGACTPRVSSDGTPSLPLSVAKRK